MTTENILLSAAVMALVTYLIRAIPITLVKRKLKSPFIKSFIYYVPFAVLSAMTVPSIFYSTSSPLSALAGFGTAILLAFFNRSLLTVSISACAAVLLCEWGTRVF